MPLIARELAVPENPVPLGVTDDHIRSAVLIQIDDFHIGDLGPEPGRRAQRLPLEGQGRRREVGHGTGQDLRRSAPSREECQSGPKDDGLQDSDRK